MKASPTLAASLNEVDTVLTTCTNMMAVCSVLYHPKNVYFSDILAVK